MGQIEVFNLLKDLGKKSDRFYTKKEVEEILRSKGFSNGLLKGLNIDLMRLNASGYLEVKFNWDGKFLDWKKEFRLKKKYCSPKTAKINTSETRKKKGGVNI